MGVIAVPIGIGTYLAIAAAVAATAAAAASAYAQHQAGEAQAKAAKYQARLTENQAIAARQAAAVAEARSRERTDRVRALARTRAEASGVSSTEGSPLLVMMENAREAELEAQLIRYGGETQAGFLGDEAKLHLFSGRVARNQAAIGAGTTLLSGVANAAGVGASYYSRRSSTTTGRDYGSNYNTYQTYRAGERRY